MAIHPVKFFEFLHMTHWKTISCILRALFSAVASPQILVLLWNSIVSYFLFELHNSAHFLTPYVPFVDYKLKFDDSWQMGGVANTHTLQRRPWSLCILHVTWVYYSTWKHTLALHVVYKGYYGVPFVLLLFV